MSTTISIIVSILCTVYRELSLNLIPLSLFSPIDQITIQINNWLQEKDHYPMEIIEESGGERALVTTLMIGAFKYFDLDIFLDFLRLCFNTVRREEVQVFVMAHDDEPLMWKEIKI